MIIWPTLPGGYVIFCDDVRQEINGKFTYVGIYGGQMTIWGDAPIGLSQLYCVMSLRLEPSMLPAAVTLRIVRRLEDENETLWEAQASVPEMDESLFPTQQASDPEARSFAELRGVQRFAPLLVTQDCKLSVVAVIGDDEYRLGSMNILVRPASEAPH